MPNKNVVLLFYSTLQSTWTFSVCIKNTIYFLSVSLYSTRSVINRIITTTFCFERRKSTFNVVKNEQQRTYYKLIINQVYYKLIINLVYNKFLITYSNKFIINQVINYTLGRVLYQFY